MLNNKALKHALKNALSEAVAEIVTEIDMGKFETVHIECPCGRVEHEADHNFCGNCGRKLMG
jgi:hypothetical protein